MERDARDSMDLSWRKPRPILDTFARVLPLADPVGDP